MKKIIIVIIILAAGAYFAVSKYKTGSVVTPTAKETMEAERINNTDDSAINAELNDIDLGDTDSKFEDVSADLKTL